MQRTQSLVRSLALVSMVVLPLAAAHAQQTYVIDHSQVTVVASNDEWRETGITVTPGDLIVVVADGQVRVMSGLLRSMWTVDANGVMGGRDKDGTLQLKIGSGGTRPIGARGFIFAEESGALKLKVQGTHYEGSSGSFTVRIVHVPAPLIPPPSSPKP